MKQLELNLKKRLLIVEVPRLADYEFINKDSKYLRIGDEEIKLNIPTLSKLEIVCKGSELTEEIAEKIILFNEKTGLYDGYYSPLVAFFSAIESKDYYWSKNPLGDEPEDISYLGNFTLMMRKKHQAWKEAESKTFNPEKTLIFEIL